MPLLNPGDPFPRLTLNLPGGETLTLPDAFAGDFAVVLFYRGAWCPYCNAQLRAFQRASQQLADAGIRVAALSVDDWVAAKALAVLAGDSGRASQEITAEAGSAGLSASRRNGADACVRYLTGKQQFLRYDQALAAGWPIATGVIEGACRHLIGDRLDITGARWGLDGAEAVLTLRAVISNGDFEEYWRFHLAREHQRLYPGTAQGQYTLGA